MFARVLRRERERERDGENSLSVVRSSVLFVAWSAKVEERERERERGKQSADRYPDRLLSLPFPDGESLD